MGEHRGKLPMINEEFVVEHLASFPQDINCGYKTPAESLDKLKKISSDGGLWAQKMNMSISLEKLLMANGETMEVIEEYPMEQINLCITILDDNMFENLLIFATKPSQEKVGAVHLFQCKPGETDLISGVINYQMENRMFQLNNNYMNNVDSQDVPVIKNGRNSATSQLSSDSSDGASQSLPTETRTQYNLQQKHKVAQVVQAFQEGLDKQREQSSIQPKPGMVGQVTKLQDAKITRDVEILNKCIEEIENFVVMLKRINEARKQLQAKKGKSKKKKVEDILILQSQPPPEHRVLDIYQKFKHALNLLGKLQPHISDPNAPELIHYLFIPLGIIVKVTGLDKARSVLDPLLTNTCVDLLMHCLDSREYHFWNSLGPNWTLTKSAEQFKLRYIQPYMPVFVDGWVPPEVVPNEKHEAAAKSIARMHEHRKSSEIANSNPTVIKAAMKFKENISENKYEKENDKGLRRSHSSSGILQVNTAGIQQPSTQRNNSFSTKGSEQQLIGIVIYDYLAHNNKELTIQAGEKVIILENSRRWWFVQNSHGEQGFVPSTVLELLPTDIADFSMDNVGHASKSITTTAIKYENDNSRKHDANNVKPSSNPPSPMESNQNYINEIDMSTPPPIINKHMPQSNRYIPSPPITQITPPPQPVNNVTNNITPPPQPMNNTYTTTYTHVAAKNITPPPQPMNHTYTTSYTTNVTKKITPPSQPVNRTAPVLVSVKIPKKPGNENGYNGNIIVSTIPRRSIVNDGEYNGNSSPLTVSTMPRRSIEGGEQIVKIPSTSIVLKREESFPSFDYNCTPIQDDERVGTAVLRKIPQDVQPKRISPNDSSRTPPKRISPNDSYRTPPKRTSPYEASYNLPILTIPPPPTPPPPPPQVFQSTVLPKAYSSKPREVSPVQENKDGEFQNELLHRLSLQTENVPNIDSVDVFIPLYKSSTADDVSRWLRKLGFSQNAIDVLKGKTAHELFQMKKELLLELLGNTEGKQLYDELLVQNGAKKGHDTMTEFQKALVHRVQKREEKSEKNDSYSSQPSETKKYDTDEMKKFEEQSSAIKRQKEELQRLKQGQAAREPGSATFTSFQSDNDITSQNMNGNHS